MATATVNTDVAWAPQPGSQSLFVTCPIYEACFEGTRGPGKTDALLMDFARDVGVGWGANWRGILFRRTSKQLDDVVARSKKWFRQIFPGARFLESRASYKWVFPDGEELLLRHFNKQDDYWDYHGHEYPWIGWEELTTWPSLDGYELMKSCSRSSFPGMPRRIRSTTNPWGIGHGVVKMYFIDPAPRGVVIKDEQGLERVAIHGHWSENKALLDAEPDYPKKIASLAGTNDHKRRAWLNGDWDIVAGGMFDDVWDASVHILDPFPIPKSWRIDRSFDWGSSKPFAVGWTAESDGTGVPKGLLIPRGSLIEVAEWYGWDGKKPNVGIAMTDVNIAKGIVQRENAMGIRARVRPGPADSMIFNAEPGRTSIGDEMKKHGATFTEADKRSGSRVTGWETIRRRLQATLERNPEEKHLYVFSNCRQFIRTVPVLPRDENNMDDVDTDAEDHIGDRWRYRVMAPPAGVWGHAGMTT
jgi:hypothetical protein